MKLAIKLGLCTLVLAAIGCDKKASVPPAMSPTTTLTQADMKGPAKASGPDASVDTNGLHVSDAIARACALPKQESHASFDFDSTSIAEDDKTVLEAVAKCLTEGALRGHSVSLIGRADPRGEEEYNMGLGGSRSESVRHYLHDLGVQKERLGATSRGEIDAMGTDEQGWARDRRVDIELVN